MNGSSNTTLGGKPASASSSTVHRGGQGQGALTQEVMDRMLQNATFGMQMLDVALRAKSQPAPGPPTSQHYPHQYPSQSQHQPHHQPPLNSSSSLTAPSTQIQPPLSTTPVTAGSSSSSSYGYNVNSHPHAHQNSNSSSSSPRMMKDGGVKSGDDGGRKVKSESGVEKGVPTNGTSSSATATATTSTAGAGNGVGSTAKRQVGSFLFFVFCLQHKIFTQRWNIEN